MIIQQLLISTSAKSLPMSVGSINLVLANIIPKLQQDPTLIEIDGPVTVVGDIHGMHEDLIRALGVGGMPLKGKFLFLGDYVDRGPKSLECITLLYALKIKYPENIYLIRGNHETEHQSEAGGFLSECNLKASKDTWKKFVETFDYLPIAAVVNKKIFCVHGGISPELQSLSQLRSLKRPFKIPESGMLCDLTWSDPDPATTDFAKSSRGTTYTWGLGAVKKLFKENGLEMIVRGHQMAPLGFNYPFPDDHCVMTIFTSSKDNFMECGKAAVMQVEKDAVYTVVELSGTPPRLVMSK